MAGCEGRGGTLALSSDSAKSFSMALKDSDKFCVKAPSVEAGWGVITTAGGLGNGGHDAATGELVAHPGKSGNAASVNTTQSFLVIMVCFLT